MSFPPAFLEELRSRLPLSEVVGKRIKLTRAGREYKACCPFHNEKSPSFYVNDDKQFYHCFGCGAHGDVIGFTMRHDRLSFPEAVESLAGQAGLQVPRDTPVDKERFDKEKRLAQLLERATVWFEEQLFAPSGREALSYLRGRGLSDDAIRRFRLGYAPNDGQALIRKLTSEDYKMEELIGVGLAKKSEDRNEFYSFFRNRVIFPVGDRRGRIVAFGGRVMGDGEPKYLNSPDHPLFHKGKLLYGVSRARTAINQNQPIIVVEGYMDVIALVEAGYSGAVAPLGTALTEDQLVLLWKLLPPEDARDPARDYSPILCFDGDNAGLRAAARSIERVIPLLSSAQTIRIATLTGAKDPDDLIRQSGKSAMDAVLKQAKPMIDAIWEISLAGRPLRTPEERGSFIAALKQRVSRIGNDNLRKLYQDDIQKRLQAAFNWSGKSENEGRSPNRGSWRPPQPPIPLMNRKQPINAQRLRERALLALMINHPDLFSDFGEDLAHISFSSPDFEALRQRITDILSLDSHEPLDAAELYRHLSQAGEAGFGADSQPAGLAEVLSETTYMHVSFARPDRPLDQAREGWKSIWNKHLQEQLNSELQFASRRYAEEASDENLTRLLALRGQVEAMMAELGDTNTSDATLNQES
ncbi:MAG: DNA primase [Alphaproteobacteria bacterium]